MKISAPKLFRCRSQRGGRRARERSGDVNERGASASGGQAGGCVRVSFCEAFVLIDSGEREEARKTTDDHFSYFGDLSSSPLFFSVSYGVSKFTVWRFKFARAGISGLLSLREPLGDKPSAPFLHIGQNRVEMQQGSSN